MLKTLFIKNVNHKKKKMIIQLYGMILKYKKKDKKIKEIFFIGTDF